MICTMCHEEVEPERITADGICEECQRNMDEALIGDDEEEVEDD